MYIPLLSFNEGVTFKMKDYCKSSIIQLTLLTFIFVSVLSPAYSSVITSDELLSDYQAAEVRSEVLNLLDRSDVQKVLIDHGVDPDYAKLRVSSMTDLEVAKLNDEIDKLPAGQGVLEVIAIVLVILVLTEVLGFTNFSDKI
jgi:hypothetical protein